jgi:hypothetical protein
MKIENVYLRSFVASLFGSVLVFVLGLIFGRNTGFSWKMALIYFVLMMVALIGRHFLKKYTSS